MIFIKWQHILHLLTAFALIHLDHTDVNCFITNRHLMIYGLNLIMQTTSPVQLLSRIQQSAESQYEWFTYCSALSNTSCMAINFFHLIEEWPIILYIISLNIKQMKYW